MRRQAAAVAVALALVVVNGAGFAGQALTGVLDNLMQLLAGITAVICGCIGARRHTGRQRSWRLAVAGGMAGWSAGQVIWGWNQWVHDGALTSPSWADVGYLSLPVFVLPALFVAAKGAGSSGHRLERDRRVLFALGLTLDGLIITTSLFTLAWTAVLSEAVRSRPDDVGDWVAIMYPVTDFLMVVVAVLLLVFKKLDPADRRSFGLLTVGIVALAFSDSIYAYLFNIGAASMKPWADAGFVVGPLFIGFAMLGTAAVGKREHHANLGGYRVSQLALPFTCLIAVGVLVVCQLVANGRLEQLEAWLAMSVVLMVVAKQLAVLIDNRHLIRRVYDGQRQLEYQANHDTLTGLANRRLFTDRLEAAIADRRPVTVIFLDVDDLKEVNDRFGHTVGDGVLLSLGQRLAGCVRREDTVARFGGDEFAILIAGDAAPAAAVTARISAALRTPFVVATSSITVHVSMGVVVADFDESLLSADELMRRADHSMHQGKRRGKNTTVLYEPPPADEEDFAAALRGSAGGVPERFALCYQPITRLDGSIVAVEALSRWATPSGKAVPPSTFVPAVETAGLGAVFDTMVLDLACREVSEAGFRYPVHVNIGPARLVDGAFEAAVADTIARYGVPGRQLILEITETMPISNLSDAAGAIRRLQSLGVRVALDDFGTGYNSLMYLQALPVDLIKLDRSLTNWFNPDETEVLYHSVMRLCLSAGFGIVAEGIESADQAERIRTVGCSLAQGYHFGRPAPLESVSRRSRRGPILA